MKTHSFHGFEIVSSEFIPEGSWVFCRGSEVISVTSKKRREFLAKFGLATELPPGTNRIIVDPAEYLVIQEAINDEEANR